MTKMVLRGGMWLDEAAQRGGCQPAETAVATTRGVAVALDLGGAELEQRDQLVRADEGIPEGAPAVERKHGARDTGPLGDEGRAERHRRRVERGQGGEGWAVGGRGAPDDDLCRLAGPRRVVPRAAEAANRSRL